MTAFSKTYQFSERQPVIAGEANVNFDDVANYLNNRNAGTASWDSLVIKGPQPWVDVKAYGAVGDGTTDDTTAVQAALTAANVGSCVFFPYGTYKVTPPLTWDVAKVSLLSYGATISTTNSNSATNLIETISSEASNPYYQATTRVQGLKFSGNGCNGIAFKGAVGNPGASHISFLNSSFANFNKALDFQTHAYVMDFIACDNFQNTYGVYVGSGFSDYGERITFIGCTIFNNTNGVYANNVNADIYLVNCSLDNNSAYMIKVDGGRVFSTGTHFESGSFSDIPFQVTASGSLISLQGGILLFSGATPTYIFSNTAGYKGGITVRDTFIQAMAPSNGQLATGDVDMSGTRAYNDDGSSAIVSTANNLLIDGGFEQGSILDDVFITADTAAIASRTPTGTNIQLSVSATEHHSGAQSLKAVKAGAAGTAAKFIICAPVQYHNAIPGISFWFKNPGSVAGTWDFSWGYGKMQATSATAFNRSVGNTTTVTPGSSWTQFNLESTRNRIPYWATHIYIEFNMASMGAGSYYFDDIYFTEM
jgi:hypothetical protein